MGKPSNADETEVNREKKSAGDQPCDDQGEFLTADVDPEKYDRVELVGKGRKRMFDEILDSGGHCRWLLSRTGSERQRPERVTG